jgi:DNA-binding IclR family transcriptional regulator
MEDIDRSADEPASPKGIGSVDNAVQILTAIEQARRPITLSDISRMLDMAPSKAYRYLVSLVRTGMVAKSESTGRYDLGPLAGRIGGEAIRRTNDLAVVTEHSTSLRDRTGHSVNIAAWGEDAPIIVRWDYGSRALPIIARTGARVPLFASSAGRVFLAMLPDAMVGRLIDTQVSTPGPGPRNPEQIRADIEATRRDGVATLPSALIPGTTSMSAGVLAEHQPLPLVLTVLMPESDVSEVELRRTGDALRDAIATAARDLGA